MKKLEDYNIEKYKIQKEFIFEYRFKIVDKETGKIFDDAQGYGYKTKQSAYKSLTYKLKRLDPEIKKLYNLSNILYKKYKIMIEKLKISANDDIEYMLFNSMKTGDDFTNVDINKHILSQIEIEIPELYLELKNNIKLKNILIKKIYKK